MAYLNDLKFVNGVWVDQYTNDTIYGTAENDTVNLYGGNDFFNDIDGGDDYVFDVSSRTGAWSGQDVISTGIGNDTVVSSLDSPNSIYQYGGQGYYGGLGIDTLNFIPNQTGVYVNLDTAIAQNNITGETTQIIGFENVTGSAYNDYIYGDYRANVLSGYNGGDTINGGGGGDRIDGGRGDDQVLGGDGSDTVQGGFDNDLVSGDAGNDFVDGGSGNDKVYGGAGKDTMFGSDGEDFMNGQTGNDIINGGNGNDLMFGGAGNDYMTGGLGNDLLDGSTGKDFMIGGGGADTFVFRALTESQTLNPDTIYDFVHGVDKIDVFFINAKAASSGDQKFNYIGDHSFSNAGQIKSHFDAAQNITIVSFNTDNDSAAEMTINLTGHITLSSNDFVL